MPMRYDPAMMLKKQQMMQQANPMMSRISWGGQNAAGGPLPAGAPTGLPGGLGMGLGGYLGSPGGVASNPALASLTSQGGNQYGGGGGGGGGGKDDGGGNGGKGGIIGPGGQSVGSVMPYLYNRMPGLLGGGLASNVFPGYFPTGQQYGGEGGDGGRGGGGDGDGGDNKWKVHLWGDPNMRIPALGRQITDTGRLRSRDWLQAQLAERDRRKREEEERRKRSGGNTWLGQGLI